MQLLNQLFRAKNRNVREHTIYTGLNTGEEGVRLTHHGYEGADKLISTYGALRILMLLFDNGPDYQNSLARRLAVSGETVGNALDTLLALKLIHEVPANAVLKRRYDSRGRKGEWYGITPLGKEIALALRRCRDHLKDIFETKR